MHRRGSIRPCRLTLPLVVVALAVPAHLGVRAAASSLPAGRASVRIVFLPRPRAATDLFRKPEPQEGGRAQPSREKLPPPTQRVPDRISMIVGPTFPDGRDVPEKPADAVTIKLRAAARQAESVPPETAQPGPILVPRQPAAPIGKPRPAPPAELADEPAAQAPAELAVRPAPSAEQELAVPPGPSSEEPEPPEPRAIEPDLLPVPRIVSELPPPKPAEPPAGFVPRRQPEQVERRPARPDPVPLPQRGGAHVQTPYPAATAPMIPQRPQPLQGRSGPVLPPPPPIAGRSEQLERIAQQADRQTRRGFELASRGAYFAARSEFIKALRLLAQGLDTEHQTDLHSRSLAAGLTAIGEAADFIPTGSRLEADLNLPAIIEGHRTPVLKNANTQGLTPLSALKCYFTFAQEQLAVAAGSEVAGSMALHALGKLHAALARQSGGSVRVAESKAVAFYQAALLVYPKNLMAANDLGVLLARCGNYHEAATALKYGLSIDAQSTSWHNLAAVYGQLGQTALARQANQLSQAARQAEIDRRRARQAPSREVVRWVDPGAFNQFSGQERVKDGWLGSSEARPQMPDPRGLGAARPRQPPAAAGGKPPNTVEPHQPAQPAGKSVLGWRPWGVQEERR